MFTKIAVSIVFFFALFVFYCTRKIAEKLFNDDSRAVLALKIGSGIVVVICAILAVYI